MGKQPATIREEADNDMRIAPPSFQFSHNRNSSMSQDFDRNIFSFSNGFERSEHQQQQIRRDKLRTQILEAPPPPLVGMEEDGIQSYIFSDMFNYPSVGAATATELLESQPYRNPKEADWFSHRQGAAAGGGFEDSKNQTVLNDTATYNRHQISSINTDSAAAMQLFLMNPQQQQRRSASPSPPPTSAGLHMSSSYHAAAVGGAFGQFTGAPNNPNEILQGQGLSLSLPPPEELRLGLLFGQTAPPQYGGGASQSRHLHVGFSGLSNSKYTKAAQELLQEFCNVGRSHFKKPKSRKNPTSGGAAAAGGDSPSSSKDLPPVSASERLEHQRRKVKLSSMLDELDRRYNHYCERMQMVVNTFDMIMGYGAAAPYTMLAQKAMSRHFRCLREAISDQMRVSSEQLGEKDGAKSGLTKGETPRLKFLEQRLRQQRALHQMGGAAEQEAWRPQRGLPQRSLTILRAWLFEHFLHPYPSDADKHLLARQTGLSKNQVANWFINARVRLWKPMVEEMYLQEAKDQSEDQTATAQIPTPTAAAAAVTPPPPAKINAHENDPSPLSFNTSENHPSDSNHASPPTTTAAPPTNEAEACRKLPDGAGIESAMIRFGASSGDVTLTLGLRHDGNLPEKSYFSVRDFGSY